MPTLFSSPRPRPRPESTIDAAGLDSSPVPQPRPESSSDDSPSVTVSPRPQPRPERSSSDNDDGPSWTSLGTPELQQPKVREALAEAAAADEDESPLLSVANDLLFGADDPPDPRIDELSPEERSELAFDQRVEAGTAATLLGMGTADAVGAIKSLLPSALQFPAQVLIGTAVGRVTFPPMKEATDWYHDEVKEQPIIDPAPGIFSKENLADFVPGIVSTSAGLGVQALTTTALTGLGVSNPIVLVGAGLGAGVYGAGKAWVWTDEVAIPVAEDFVFDTLRSGIDIEALGGPQEHDLPPLEEPITIERLEELWDEVADQIPAAEAEALQPSIGVRAPDSWTIADIVRYEETGEMPTLDPELAELLDRSGLPQSEPAESLEPEIVPESAPVLLTSPVPAVPVFVSVRTEPEVIAEAEPESFEPRVRAAGADHDDDDPDPQCLVPFWLIPYLDELRALGVRNFCALADLSREELEELLFEPIEESEEPDEPVRIDDGPVLVPVFASARCEVELAELDDAEDNDAEGNNVFLV